MGGKRRSFSKRKIKVIEYTGKEVIYDSVTAVANATGLDPRRITRALNDPFHNLHTIESKYLISYAESEFLVELVPCHEGASYRDVQGFHSHYKAYKALGVSSSTYYSRIKAYTSGEVPYGEPLDPDIYGFDTITGRYTICVNFKKKEQ